MIDLAKALEPSSKDLWFMGLWSWVHWPVELGPLAGGAGSTGLWSWVHWAVELGPLGQNSLVKLAPLSCGAGSTGRWSWVHRLVELGPQVGGAGSTGFGGRSLELGIELSLGQSCLLKCR